MDTLQRREEKQQIKKYIEDRVYALLKEVNRVGLENKENRVNIKTELEILLLFKQLTKD